MATEQIICINFLNQRTLIHTATRELGLKRENLISFVHDWPPVGWVTEDGGIVVGLLAPWNQSAIAVSKLPIPLSLYLSISLTNTHTQGGQEVAWSCHSETQDKTGLRLQRHSDKHSWSYRNIVCYFSDPQHTCTHTPTHPIHGTIHMDIQWKECVLAHTHAHTIKHTAIYKHTHTTVI